MKSRKLFALAAAILSTTGYSMAESAIYTAKEKSMDLFGSYLAPERGISHLFDTSIQNGKFGGGIGFNYFASRTLGVSTDVNIPANGGKFFDSYTMNLVLRWPLGSSGLAPYLTGGGGRAYDPHTQWVAQAGLGLEYRSYHKSGLFVDGRYVWGENKSTDKLLLRAGLRVLF